MSFEGGLRDRLIDESIFQHVKGGLAALDWFNTNRKHKPIDFLATSVQDDEQILPNTIVMSSEQAVTDSMEIGSNASVDGFDVWFDLYCESDALGKQLCGDIQALVRGQMPALGFGNPVIPVYDWSKATPDLIFHVEVVSTERQKNRQRNVATPQERHMWTVLVEVEDARP